MTKNKDETPQEGDISTDSSEDIFDRYNDDEEVDEELLSLSPPPPSLRLLIFVILILTMSCVMFVWFFPELRYLTQALRDPVDLGEAADIDVAKLTPDAYAKVGGLPLIQRTLTFKEGVKWFMMSDNTRKFFPLAGQPNLYVQWAMTDEHKAYRDPETNPGVMGPPSEFKGHLVTREQMGPNFKRVWLFYDCLRHHFVGRCNYCLGRNNMDECRDAFTCRENNDAEQCGEILARSEGPLKQEIAELEKKRGDPKSRKELQKLKEIQAALREHRIAVSSVRLEEIASDAAHLQRLAKKTESPHLETLDKIRAQTLELQAEELTLRAANARRTLDTFDKEKQTALSRDLDTLNRLSREKEVQLETLRTLRAFIQVGDELEKLIHRSRELKKDVALLPPPKLAVLDKWNPESRDGKEILQAVGDLEEAVVAVKRKDQKPEATEHAPEKSAPPDAGVAEAAAKKAEDEMLASAAEKLADNPDYQTLQTKLDKVVERASLLQKKLDALTPGRAPEFEHWARTPDVQGAIPEAVRDTAFVGAIQKIETMLAGVTPVGGTPEETSPSEETQEDTADGAKTLAEQMDQGIDRLDDLKKQIKELESRPGILELRTMRALEQLRNSIKPSMSMEEAGRVVTEISQLVQEMTAGGFYMTKLKGAPDEMTRFEKLLTPEALTGLQKQLNEVSAHIENKDWVLIDGEIPLDKLWVLLVYAVLSIMVVVNIRKLWRFWLAFKN